MQRREFWERQFKVFLCKFTPKQYFTVKLSERNLPLTI